MHLAQVLYQRLLLQTLFSFCTKAWLLLVPVLVTSYVSIAQTSNAKTELFIIGTIHYGNKKFDHRTLYQLLKQYNPDVILQEQSNPYSRVFGLKTATFLRIAKPSIEQLALQQYTKHNPAVLVLPYDTSIAERKLYVKNVEQLKGQLYGALNKANMSHEDSLVYARYANQYNDFFAQIDREDLPTINTPETVDIPRQLYQKQRNEILPLAKKYVSDTLLVQAYEDDLDFWIARNDYMVKTIVGYAKQFEGKRIVVLTGHFHKYYLQPNIAAKAGDNLVINPIEMP
jgi:hypothetical protein